MTALQKLPYLTEQNYLAFELTATIRHEYKDGYIYAMAGASERHNRISLNVGFQLRSAARGGQCGVFMSDMKLKIAQHNAYYYPDVLLVCDTEDKQEYYKERPCLITEVLSTSTAKIDRREKLLAYLSLPSLRYYLLIDANKKRCEYYVRDSHNEWQTALLEENEELVISCENYQTVLKLNDIYEDVLI